MFREKLLEVIEAFRPRPGERASYQTGSVLSQLKANLNRQLSFEEQENILTELHELFRTGYLAWGNDLGNPGPPFFHVTKRGNILLARLARDPGNPEGYLRYVKSRSSLNEISEAYLIEAIACYGNGLFKAAAVMLGAASESSILQIRDSLVRRFQECSQEVPRELNDWKIKVVFDAISRCLEVERRHLNREIRDALAATFPSFFHLIRVARNDAGHPTSIDPVTEESVLASFLMFPELCFLSTEICRVLEVASVSDPSVT